MIGDLETGTSIKVGYYPSGIRNRSMALRSFNLADSKVQSEHIHDMKEFEEVAASCTEDGTVGHYECSKCHKLFVLEGEDYIEKKPEELVIKSEGHIYNQEKPEERYLASPASCTASATYYKSCKCGEVGSKTFGYGDPDPNAHDWNDVWETVEGDDSTCAHKGQEYDTCKLNPDHKRYRNKELANHMMTHVPSVSATCSTDGIIEYWHCSICNGFFTDKDGLTEIGENDTIVSAKGHSFGQWNVTSPATEISAGLSSRSCSYCGKTETKQLTALEPTLPSIKISKPKAAKKICYHQVEEGQQEKPEKNKRYTDPG